VTIIQGDTRSSAERTATIVVNAARSGAPLCIPGARESRLRTDPVSAALWTHEVSENPTIRFSELSRLAYAREGGGALSERAAQRRGVAFRFWQLVTRRFRSA
jgi:hypothetical protein